MTIEEELKQLTEEDEDLSDDRMVLPLEQQKELLLAEREQRVVAYFGLKNAVESLKATIAYNEKHLGSAAKERNKQYQTKLEDFETEMKHQLRAVKLLDRKHEEVEAEIRRQKLSPAK